MTEPRLADVAATGVTGEGAAGLTDEARWGLFGQDRIAAALASAIGTGTLSHAYLLAGPDGVGKGTLATRLAQALLCEGYDATAGPCRECRDCRQVAANEAPDVTHLTIGGVCDIESHRDHAADSSTRIRICQVRRLQRLANLSPFHAPRRIFIVDPVDALQTEAANALLKTLEEPPGSVLLILLSTDPDGLLPTIRSRCQELTLRPMARRDIAQALQRERELPEPEAAELAELARGRYGLALRLVDDPSLRQLRETAALDLEALLDAGRNERFDKAEELARRWGRDRASVVETLDVWLGSWRDALFEAAGAGAEGSAPWTPAATVRALSAVQLARQHLLENTNPQLALDVLMLDLPRRSSVGGGNDRPVIREEARATASTAG